MPDGQKDLARNHILKGLDLQGVGALRTASEIVNVPSGQELARAGEPIRYAYFPIDGIITLVQRLGDGFGAAVGIIGPEGFWGSSLSLDVTAAPVEAVAQSSLDALRVPATVLADVLRANRELRRRVLKFTHFLYLQAAQTAACNARHSVKQRLARWLLEAHTRLGDDSVTMSHENLSFKLGIRRAGITAALGDLKEQGVIDTGRGRITILERQGLENTSCECHAVLVTEYKQLLDGV